MTLHFLQVGATLAGAALLTTGAFAQETCGAAAPVVDGANAFDTTGAVDEGSAFSCGGSGAANDLWYSYTAAADGVLVFETCTSSFDSRIEVYDDCAGAALTCNDDFCGLQSTASVSATNGTTYFVRIAGFNGATGAGTLTVTPPVAAPGNDDCDGAIGLASGVGEMFSNVAATNSDAGGAPAWTCGGTSTNALDVWYSFTLAADGMVVVDTEGSLGDTRLAVYDGDCMMLNLIDCDDDGGTGLLSSITFMGTAGTTYYARAAGFSAGIISDGVITATYPDMLPNDECSGAIDLMGGVGTAFDNTLATNSDASGAPAWSCGGASANALDLWYSFTPMTDGTVVIDTEGSLGDTRLEVYEGDCMALVSIDCDDDGGSGLLSSVVFPGTAGTTYYARVAGFSAGIISDGVITASVSGPPANDNCDAAIAVGVGTTMYSNAVATDSGVDMSCVFNGELSDVWFSFTASASCPVTVDLSGSLYDTGMSIYSGDCMMLTEVACDDDGGTGLDSLITFDAAAGTTYLIQIGGFNGASGEGVINISEDSGIGTEVCTGVANSTGVGASLKLFGSDLVADNDLTISITELPLDSMGYVITSMETNTVVNPGGSSGTICIASFTIGRFAGNVLDSGSTGTVSFSPDLTMFPAPTPLGIEAVMVGETRYFQHWYRDVDGMGGATSNFSSAQGVTFN